VRRARHQPAGQAHAEVVALARPARGRGGDDVVVTLEPCGIRTHRGRATEALIEAECVGW